MMTNGEQLDAILPLVALANELKAPLAYIKGASAVLQESADLSGQQLQLLQHMSHSSERMIRLVQGLSEVGQIELPLEPVNIGQAVDEVVQQLLPLSRSLDCTFEVKMARSAGLVVAHRTSLENALYALLDATLQQQPRGGTMTVIGRVQQQSTRVALRGQNDIAKAEVARLDTTIGRELQPIRGQGQSSGIGLYIARQLIEAMQGTLGVEHRAKRASLFVDLCSSRQISLV